MLVHVGRWSSLIAIVGWLIVMSGLVPSVQQMLNANSMALAAFNAAGALTAVAAFVSWFTAIFHWGLRFQGDPRLRRRWGLAVVFGVFIGAWTYWFKGMGEPLET